MNRSETLPFVVLKFGGSSVANPRRWRHIADAVAGNIARNRHPVLVCSALAGVTNALEAIVAAVEAGRSPSESLAQVWNLHAELATALGLHVHAVLGNDFASLADLAASAPRGAPAQAPWRARVMSAGELMSTRLGAAWLTKCDIGVQWCDARGFLEAVSEKSVSRSQAYLSARCEYAPDAALQRRLARSDAEATITQGFIARNEAGETVLLGRGGSDTSAAYLAAKLEAECLEIWTDVPGLFTTDPRRASHARLLLHVTYEEAAVLGSLGAKILHPRCLSPVRERGIPLGIRWTDRPEMRGTLIAGGTQSATTGIKAVTSRSNLCLVRMQRDRCWQPVGFMAEVATCFHNHGLSMDLISSSPSEIRATIDLAAAPGADEQLPDLIAELSTVCKPSIKRDVACVSVAGTRISEDMPRIAAVLGLLGGPAVHLVSHAADDTHVSYVLDDSVADELVAAVHSAVFSTATTDGLFGPAWSDLQRIRQHNGVLFPAMKDRVAVLKDAVSP